LRKRKMQRPGRKDPRSQDRAFICCAFLAVVVTFVVAVVVLGNTTQQDTSQSASTQLLAPARAGLATTRSFAGVAGTQGHARKGSAAGQQEPHWPHAVPARQGKCPRAIAKSLPERLARLRARVRKRAEQDAEIRWTQYAECPACYAGRRVAVSANDFRAGTLRIQSPGLFVLTEDACVEPNPAHEFRPDLPRQEALYGGPAYSLGFFAAIAVESDDVVIDLNGHTLRQSDLFAAEQRFFALLELAGQPFIGGQGPGDFGATMPRVRGVVVENGTLARSAHHGIHGNGGSDVLLQDLTFSGYEVAAVALNGFRDVVVRNCRAAGSARNVPVLGTYSNARFLLPFAERVERSALVPSEHRARVRETAHALRRLLGEARGDIAACGHINATRHPEAHALFANTERLNDGNAYGFAFHPLGIAVNGFWDAPTPQPLSRLRTENILISNCTVHGTRASIVEVVALQVPDGAFARGPAGDVVRVADNAGRVSVSHEAGTPRNALASAQGALIAAKNAAAANGNSVAHADELLRLFGTTHGSPESERWIAGGASLGQVMASGGHKFLRNGDSMFHVNKGVIGVRLDGTSGACLRDVTVANTENLGARGLQVGALPGEDGGARHDLPAYHPFQGEEEGYAGGDAYGITASGTENLYFEAVSVEGVRSASGNALGLRLFHGGNGTHVAPTCAFAKIFATAKSPLEPWRGHAIGASVDRDTAQSVYGLQQVSVSDVQGQRKDQGLALVVTTEKQMIPESKAISRQQETYGYLHCKEEVNAVEK